MTTSAVRIEPAVGRGRGGRRAGFTLLEMVVVLGIVGMLFTAALGAYYLSDDNRVLTGATDDLEVLAKRARARAALEQRPYAIEFRDGGAQLMSFAEALMEPEDRELMLEQRFEETGEVPVAESDAWHGDEGMSLLVQRWGSDGWTDVTRRNREIWRFDPNGLCEPVAVRLEMDNGSWMAVRFHPLTASKADIESDIK